VRADTHVTAPTQFVQTGGIRFAYRGSDKTLAYPLVFMLHFCSGILLFRMENHRRRRDTNKRGSRP